MEEERRVRNCPQNEQSKPEKDRKITAVSPAQKVRVPNTSPFSSQIVSVPVDRIKFPSHVRFDGSIDPTEHLNAYQGHMSLGAHIDA